MADSDERPPEENVEERGKVVQKFLSLHNRVDAFRLLVLGGISHGFMTTTMAPTSHPLFRALRASHVMSLTVTLSFKILMGFPKIRLMAAVFRCQHRKHIFTFHSINGMQTAASGFLLRVGPLQIFIWDSFKVAQSSDILL